MRKPNTHKTAATVTVEVPTTETAIVALNTAPQAGSNSAAAGEFLVSMEVAHKAIEEVLAAMADTETTLEYARQKLAYDLWLRHIALEATSPAGSVPLLGDLAGVKNRTAFLKYLTRLKVEFSGKQITVNQKTSAPDRATAEHQKKVGARLERALTLIVHLVFSGVGLDAFDTERGQWRIPSRMMILPDYEASPDLLKAPYVYLEADTKSGFFFIARQDFAPVAVTPTLTFVEKTVAAQIERTHNPLTPTVTDPKRAAQLPGSKASDKTPDAKASNATSADATDDDEPGMDMDKPATDATHACIEFAKAIITAAKWANHDGMRGKKKEDVGSNAYNSMADVVTLYHRMRAAEERKDSKLAA